jgi:rubrerythrin
VDKAALTVLRQSLENARQQLDYVIGRLKGAEEPRHLRWRCRRCEYIKHFTRPMPESAAPPCPKCMATEFEPAL